MSTAERCPFCEIFAGKAPAQILRAWPHVLAIVPLNPVVPGHTLVIPFQHVEDALVNPALTARVMGCAAQFAKAPMFGRPSCNIITSVGKAATQSVFHLHVHVVPRRHGDGLALPWTPTT